MSSSNMAEELRNFAADVDDRDEATREELDMLRQAASLIEKLEQERDEARQELCMILAGKGGRSSSISPDAIEVSKSRGWNCFTNKENEND